MKGTDIKLNTLIDTLFLLFIGLGGGFIGGGLMNCSVQRFLKHPVGINGLMFLLLFFTCNFTSDEGTALEVIFVRTLLLYALFILLLKNEYRMLILGFILLFTVYILDIQIKYYQAVIDKEAGQEHVNHVETPDGFSEASYLDKIDDFENARDILEYVTLGVLVVGIGLYMNKQYNDHKGSFSFVKFFFGTGGCENK